MLRMIEFWVNLGNGVKEMWIGLAQQGVLVTTHRWLWWKKNRGDVFKVFSNNKQINKLRSLVGCLHIVSLSMYIFGFGFICLLPRGVVSCFVGKCMEVCSSVWDVLKIAAMVVEVHRTQLHINIRGVIWRRTHTVNLSHKSSQQTGMMNRTANGDNETAQEWWHGWVTERRDLFVSRFEKPQIISGPHYAKKQKNKRE